MKWIFFDVGSTLLDEGDFNSYFFGKIYNSIAESGARIVWENFNNELRSIIEQRRYGDRAYRGIVKELVTHFSNDRRLLQEMLEDYRRNTVREYLDRIKPYPDTLAVVEELKNRYKLGVIANQPKYTRQKMSSFGLAEQFEMIVLSDEVRLRKPDTRIFLHALSLSGCDSTQAVMVGDRLDADIGPAKSLGMTTIRIRRGIMIYQLPFNSLEIADYEVNTLGDIVGLL